MNETLTNAFTIMGALFLALPFLVYISAKMATLGFYTGRDSFYRHKRRRKDNGEN